MDGSVFSPDVTSGSQLQRNPADDDPGDTDLARSNLCPSRIPVLGSPQLNRSQILSAEVEVCDNDNAVTAEQCA